MNKIKLMLASGSAVIGSLLLGFTAHAQSIPTVGTSDIAEVGGAILSPLIVGGKYVMVTFGPPLLFFGLAVLVYLTIKHYVSRRRVKV